MAEIIWNAARGEAVIAFIETLRIPEGKDAGKLFRLRDWQKDWIMRTYCPARPHGDGDGGRLLRVVRRSILSIPKKNGKTPLMAALLMTHLCGPEAVPNGQLYSGALDREQAGICYRYMEEMTCMDAELHERLIIRTAKKEMYDPVSGTSYKALSSEIKTKHGISPVVTVFDELAQFGSDREFYDTISQGQGAHEEPLELIISTQAPDDKALLSQLIDYGEAVNRGEIDDPTVVCQVYAAPMDDPSTPKGEKLDIFDEAVWRACNPALGDFLSLDDMRMKAKDARNIPSSEASFRNLRLNQRIAAGAQFLSYAAWRACAGEVDLGVFERGYTVAALDLSMRQDLTCLALAAEDEQQNVHVLPFFWTPEETLAERARRDHVPYELWRDQGHLIATPGPVVEYAMVATSIVELHGLYDLQGLLFDRWKIFDLCRELDALGFAYWIDDGGEKSVGEGLRLIPHGQGFKDMTPAVEAVEDLVATRRLRHGGHPVLTWCVSNTRLTMDPADGKKFDKRKSTGRIDGTVAMAMALRGLKVGARAPATSPYEAHGVRFI